jgi:glycerophosphoryl diester phosphodiesterase
MDVQFRSAGLGRIATVIGAYANAIARWRIVVPVYLVFRGFVLALIAPIVSGLFNLAVRFSDHTALTDQDVALVLLKPAGFVVALLSLGIALLGEVASFAIMSAAMRTPERGLCGALSSALQLVWQRSGPLAVFSGVFVARVLAVALPFALGGLLIALWYQTEFDINYYLSFQAPDFWLAMFLILGLGVLMAVALLFRLCGWAMAPHLVLFGNREPLSAFGESERRLKPRRFRLKSELVVWFGLRLVVATCVTAGLVWSITLVQTGGELSSVLFATVAILLAAVIAGTFLDAFAIGALVHLIERHVSELCDGTNRTASVPMGQRHIASGFSLVIGTIAAAVWLANGMMQSVRTEDRVEIIAHRGASGTRPENTLIAFEQAIQDGADWIELDVQETADGQIVVLHDEDLVKLARSSVKVWKASYSELAELDIGSWFDSGFHDQRPPLLSAALKLAKDRARVLIELKHYGYNEDLERRVVQAVEAAGMASDVAIMSLNYQSVLKAQHLRPNWDTGVLAGSAFGNLAGLQGDFLALHSEIASPGLINAARSAGKNVYVWTVNDPLEMSRMISKGVDGIITDEPAIARDVLNVRGELTTAGRMVLWFAAELGVRLNAKTYRDQQP